VLLYKTGETAADLARHIGDYERWFARVLPEVELELHLAFETPHHPLRGYDGMLVTGSPRSLVRPEPWMDDAAATVRAAADAGVPVLGVCFGHQLVGSAFGGRVRQNPNGWEVGTTEIELTEAGRRDPLFADLPERLRVNQSHQDEVWELGASTQRLAASTHTPTQAIAVGAHVRGVQFHPEMDGFVIQRLIEHRRAILDADARQRGRAPVDDVLARSGDTPEAERVLVNFARHFVRKS
jgi:GMP synthase (glutamine-hydrolysing)